MAPPPGNHTPGRYCARDLAQCITDAVHNYSKDGEVAVNIATMPGPCVSPRGCPNLAAYEVSWEPKA